MPKNYKVRFHFLKPFSLTNREQLKQFIQRLFKSKSVLLEGLDIIFCDDSYLLAINRQFLRHDNYTDIISFPLSTPGDPLVGEIYISIDRIKENATHFGSSYREEIHRVIFHGVLHFCGYKDKKPQEIALMRKMEKQSLDRYFSRNVPRGTDD